MTQAVQALSAALAAMSQNSPKEANFAEILKQKALENLEMAMASNSLEDKAIQIKLLEMGIAVIVSAVLVGYFHWNSTKKLRIKLDQEVNEKRASFVLPITGTTRKQIFIQNFVSLLKKTLVVDSNGKKIVLADLAGLLEVQQSDATLYILMPSWFLEKSQESIADRRPLQSMRRVLDAFLQEDVPEQLAAIEAKYKEEWGVTSWTKAWFSTYLDDIRAARFLEICLANILSKLRWPRDANDRPLSAKENIELCRRFGIFLNDILKSVETETLDEKFAHEPTLLQNFNRNKNRLTSYIRDIEIETFALRNAYVQDHLNEFNLDDVVNSAHNVLEKVNSHLLKLIYKRPFSTRKLFHKASYLRDIFQKNPNIIDCFQACNANLIECMNPNLVDCTGAYAKLRPKTLLINTPPTTVMDALILFTHMTVADRKKLINTLAHEKAKDSEKEFAETLGYFDEQLIQPIAFICRKELKKNKEKNQQNYDDVDVAIFTAQRALPIMTLIFRSRETNLDTEKVLEKIKTQHLMSAEQQIEEINKKVVLNYKFLQSSQGSTSCGLSAESKYPVGALDSMAESGNANSSSFEHIANTPNEFKYSFLLDPFVKVDPETLNELNRLGAHQFHLIQVTTLLDSVRNLLHSNRCMLQQKEVFDFVRKCIEKIRSEYTVFEEIEQKLVTKTLNDEGMSRHLKSDIDKMILDINKSFDHLKSVTEDIAHVMSEPNFIQRQKEILIAQIRVINQQYTQLYSEPTGLEGIASVSLNPPNLVYRENETPVNKAIALSTLIHNCYHNLSPSSRQGVKGKALCNLKNTIDSKKAFTHDEFAQSVRDLARIVMLSTETIFFQAQYAQTRSGCVLIQAIQNPRLNGKLGLSTILFNDVTTDYSGLQHAQLVNCFQMLRQKNKWPYSAGELKEKQDGVLAHFYMQAIGASLLVAGLVITTIGALGLAGFEVGLVGVAALAITATGGISFIGGGALLGYSLFRREAYSRKNEELTLRAAV